MKRVISTLIVSAIALLPSAVLADAGNKLMIFSASAEYLGEVTPNKTDVRSICHPVGYYATSYGYGIYNPDTPYGSPSSPNSAYNPNAQQPPVLMNGRGQLIGFVTKNPGVPKSMRIDPDVLKSQVCGG